MAIALQSSLLYKPSLSPHSLSNQHLLFSPRHSNSLPFLHSRFVSITCTLHPDSLNSSGAEIAPSGSNSDVIESQFSNKDDVYGGVREAKLEETKVSVDEKLAEPKSNIAVVALCMGVWGRVRSGLEKSVVSDWLSNSLPFWGQEKRLDRLIAEADANPKDAAKQSALLTELNKHNPESVIHRFDQREHAVDSRGVAEYLRALVVTNTISEYLPDEESGKPSSLLTLVKLEFVMSRIISMMLRILHKNKV